MDRYLRRYAKCYNGFELAIVRFCSHFAREILKTVSNSCRNWDSHRVQCRMQQTGKYALLHHQSLQPGAVVSCNRDRLKRWRAKYY